MVSEYSKCIGFMCRGLPSIGGCLSGWLQKRSINTHFSAKYAKLASSIWCFKGQFNTSHRACQQNIFRPYQLEFFILLHNYIEVWQKCNAILALYHKNRSLVLPFSNNVSYLIHKPKPLMSSLGYRFTWKKT
jgi:hypothetical protein